MMPGIDTLTRWLAAHDKSYYVFALQIGWDPPAIRKLLDGKVARVSVELAAKIEDATEGVVPIRSWIPTK